MDHKDGPPPEIVIIRRGGKGHEDGHHGGAWKIAYADFMTAMMALFLVMWLIGASDEKTIAQVATYFNPVPLTDRTTTEKGVQDKQQGGTGKEEDRKPPKTRPWKVIPSRRMRSAERVRRMRGLFADPYNVSDQTGVEGVESAVAGRAAAVFARTRHQGRRGDGLPGPFRSGFPLQFHDRGRQDPARSSLNTTPPPMLAVLGNEASRTGPPKPTPMAASPALSPPRSRRSRPRRPRIRQCRRAAAGRQGPRQGNRYRG